MARPMDCQGDSGRGGPIPGRLLTQEFRDLAPSVSMRAPCVQWADAALQNIWRKVFMKRDWKFAAFCLACGVLFGTSLVFAAEKDKEKTTGKDAKASAEMEAWMKAATPGEHHKNLNFFVGDWKTQNTMWMDGSETKTEGTAHIEWAMDGRYVISKHSGNFMGMPFQGMGIDGYDNVTSKYF